MKMFETSISRANTFVIIAVCVVFTFILAQGCQRPNRISSNWRNEQQRQFQQQAADLGSDLRNLTLSVSQVAALDEQTLLLGGSYRSSAASVRSALLRSVDGGKTWQDTGVWLTGYDTWRIFVLDERHAYDVVNYSIEGWLSPFVIFRTRDGGVTWHRSEQDLPFEHIGIPMDAGFSFASPRHGQFWIVGSMGVKHYYTTTNGGRRWKLSYVADMLPGGEPIECKYERDWTNKRVLILLCPPNRSNDYETVGIINTDYTIDKQGNITPQLSEQ
jgi:hypothetical protein